LPLGEQLRKARERAGVTLVSLSESTKVALHHLQALEADHVDELPPGIFRKGLVRSYCACLGLDELPYLNQLPVHDVASHDELARFAENVKRSRTAGPGAPRFRWLGVLLMLLSLAAAAWWVLRHEFGVRL
jgi:cytoskeleton protein RodZ